METFKQHEVCGEIPLKECWRVILERRQGEAGVPLQVSREGDQEGYAAGLVLGDPAVGGQEGAVLIVCELAWIVLRIY